MKHTIQTAAMLLLLCLMPGRLVSAADVPEEIVIKGKVSGPPLWQVRHGENTLWIFGLLSPLPPDLELDTTRIESVLATADEALNEPDFDSADSLGLIKMFRLYRQFRQTMANDNGATLQQVLPAELYQQLLTVKASHGPRSDKLLKVRPLMAAELLEGAAFKSVALDEDTRHVNKRLLRLIRRHEVPLTEVVYQSDMSYSSVLEAIGTVPYDTEINCLRAMLDGIETGACVPEGKSRSLGLWQGWRALSDQLAQRAGRLSQRIDHTGRVEIGIAEDTRTLACARRASPRGQSQHIRTRQHSGHSCSGWHDGKIA